MAELAGVDEIGEDVQDPRLRASCRSSVPAASRTNFGILTPAGGEAPGQVSSISLMILGAMMVGLTACR